MKEEVKIAKAKHEASKTNPQKYQARRRALIEAIIRSKTPEWDSLILKV